VGKRKGNGKKHWGKFLIGMKVVPEFFLSIYIHVYIFVCIIRTTAFPARFAADYIRNLKM
jgi:hypothetical protein